MYNSGNRGFAAAVITGGLIGVGGAAALRPVASTQSPQPEALNTQDRGHRGHRGSHGPSRAQSGTQGQQSPRFPSHQPPMGRRQPPVPPAGRQPSGAVIPPNQPNQPPVYPDRLGGPQTRRGEESMGYGANAEPFDRTSAPSRHGRGIPFTADRFTGEEDRIGQDRANTTALRVVPTVGSSGSHHAVPEAFDEVEPTGTGDFRSGPVGSGNGGHRTAQEQPAGALRVVPDMTESGEQRAGSGTAATSGYQVVPGVAGSGGYRPITELIGTGGFQAGPDADGVGELRTVSDFADTSATGYRDAVAETGRPEPAAGNDEPTPPTWMSGQGSDGFLAGNVAALAAPSIPSDGSAIGALGPAEGSLGTGFHSYGGAVAPEVEFGGPKRRSASGLYRDRAVEPSLGSAAVASQQLAADRSRRVNVADHTGGVNLADFVGRAEATGGSASYGGARYSVPDSDAIPTASVPSVEPRREQRPAGSWHGRPDNYGNPDYRNPDNYGSPDNHDSLDYRNPDNYGNPDNHDSLDYGNRHADRAGAEDGDVPGISALGSLDSSGLFGSLSTQRR